MWTKGQFVRERECAMNCSVSVSENEMLIAEDALIADVQFALHNLLAKKEVSRAELARRMNVSDAYVSQMFRDHARNLTLKTIARIFRAVDEDPRITSETLDSIVNRNVSEHTPARDIASFTHREEVIRQMLHTALSSEFRRGHHNACKANDNEKIEEVVVAA